MQKIFETQKIKDFLIVSFLLKTNMEKSIKITLIIVGAVILLALMGWFAIYSFMPDNLKGQTITMAGTSNLKVNPDVVSVYFNVETNGTTASEAKDANSRVIDSLTFSLISAGLDKEDIETLSFQISEDNRWENGRTKSYGYKASHQIRIVLDSVTADDIGKVIDAGVDAGAMLSYINFELSSKKQNEYKALALKEAGIDSRTKAEATAEGLGLKITKVVSISTSEFGYSPWNIYSSSGAMDFREDAVQAKVAATNIQPGEQEVSGYVTVVYALK